MLILAGILGSWSSLSADTPEPTALPMLLRYDGSSWVSLERHGIYVTGAGATKEGTATATFKSKLDGPKTYVVIAGTTSELVLSDPKPRFRVASDKATAQTVQLAEFEPDNDAAVRSTTIERVRRGVFFTKGVDLEVAQISDGLFELRPTKSLQPGEYALVTTDTDPVADFTIVDRGY